MRNFLQVGTNIDTLPLQMTLAIHPELWDIHKYRTTFDGTPFEGMSDILLRYSDPYLHFDNKDPKALIDDRNLVFYPAWERLPEVKPVIFDLMRRFCGIWLGRVIIARLPPGGVILPHADNYGAYATVDKGMRFHVVIKALPGNQFHCGEDTIQPATGQAWWFRHQERHSAENNSADDRIHLLIDMTTA